MAAGMLLAPRSPGSKRKRFGAKPKMFDLWFKEGEENWEDVLVCLTPSLLSSGS